MRMIEMRAHLSGPKMVTKRVGVMYGTLRNKGYTIRPGCCDHMLTMPMNSGRGAECLVEHIHNNQIVTTHLYCWTRQLPVNAHHTFLIAIGQDALRCKAISDNTKRTAATSATVGRQLQGGGVEWGVRMMLRKKKQKK